MKLTVVGCAGSYPNRESAASCYLVEHDGFGLLLDLGSGSFGQLAKYRDVRSVDAVALSHFHLDHCADVSGLYVSRRYDPAGPHPAIPVLGPPGVDVRMNQMYGLDGVSESMSSSLTFIEYPDDPVQLGPFHLSVAPVKHCVQSYAIKIVADGKSLVYSGDTGPCDNLTSLAGGADVALFEASNIDRPDNPPNLHMSGVQAAETAVQARVGQLVLTHFVAWYDTNAIMKEAQEVFGEGVIQARPGLQLEIGDTT